MKPYYEDHGQQKYPITLKRGRFYDLLEDLESWVSLVGIMAWHPDRLARNMVDGGELLNLITEKPQRFEVCYPLLHQ